MLHDYETIIYNKNNIMRHLSHVTKDSHLCAITRLIVVTAKIFYIDNAC